MWKLTDLAEAQIDALEAEGFHVTPQEVLHIQQLSLDVVSPVDGVSLARGVPVRVGNVVLWPPTIASHCYFSKVLEDRRLSPRLRLLALAYSMANAKDPDVVGGEPDLRAVKRWARRLCCRIEELAEAVNLQLGDGAKPFEKKEPDPKLERASVSALAQEAVALCGGSPEMWEYQVTLPYVRELVDRTIRLRNALEGHPLKEAEDATRALVIYIDTLRKRKQHGPERA